MATNIGSLAVQITGSSAGLSTALKQAESGVKHSMAKIAAIATGVGAGLFAGFSFGSFILDSIKIAGEMEDIAASFKTMTGDAAEGEQLFRDIEDASDSMRMSVKDTAEAAKGLFSADVAADQIVPTLRLLGDIAMGDADKLKTLSQAYAKVVDDGIVSSRTLRAFAGAGVFLGGDIAKAMGLDKNEFKEALEDGKVGLRDLQAAMLAATGEGGKFFGGIEKRMGTFAGKLDALSNMWEDFKWDLGDILIEELGLKGLLDGLTNGLGVGRKNLDQFRPIISSIKDIVIEIATALAIGLQNAAIAAAQLVNILNKIEPEGSGIGGTTFGQKTPNWWERNASLGGLSNQIFGESKFGRATSFLGPGGGGWAHRKMFGGVAEGSGKKPGDIFDTEKMAKKFKALGDLLAGVGAKEKTNWIEDIFNSAGESAKKLDEAFKQAAISAMAADKKFVQGAMDKAFPLEAMRREAGDLRKNLAWNMNGAAKGDIAFNAEAAGIFDKFVKDFGGAVQLSSVALQDSSDAVSAISRNRIGGKMDLQARAAAALDQLVVMEKENQRINAAKAAAIQNWIIKNGPLP